MGRKKGSPNKIFRYRVKDENDKITYFRNHEDLGKAYGVSKHTVYRLFNNRVKFYSQSMFLWKSRDLQRGRLIDNVWIKHE